MTEHYQELQEERRPLDTPEEGDEDMRVTETVEDADAYESGILEELPLPGMPIGEANRKRKWLKLPRNARLAIRRMHNEWGHKPKSVVKAILKAAQAPKEYVDAVDNLRCEACDATAPNPQTKKSAPPKPYVFNHDVGVDLLDLHDADGNSHLFLNIVCQGTNFQIVWYLCPRAGVASSRLCVQAFMQASSS